MTRHAFHITRVPTTKGETVYLYVRIKGHRYREKLGVNLTADEATQKAAARLDAIYTNLAPAKPARVTLAAVTPLYIRKLRAGTCLSSQRQERIIDNHLLPFFKGRLLESLQAEDGFEYLERRRGAGAAAGSLANEWGIFMAILNVAVEFERLSKNRLTGVPRPKATRRERIATHEELHTLLERADDRLQRTIVFALMTCLREALLLQVNDSWLSGRDDGFWLLLPKARTKTKNNPLALPLNRPALWGLDGKWFTKGGCLSAWERLLVKTGVVDLHFHDLRHTGLTWLQNAGVSYEVRQALAGHAMPGMTATYSHGGAGFNQMLREAVDNPLIFEYLSKSCPKKLEATLKSLMHNTIIEG